MNTTECPICYKEHYDIIKGFCSVKCEEVYWANPYKINITTRCPSCKEDFSRDVFLPDCRNYQGLTLCPKCSDNNRIIIGKKYV